MTSGCATTLCDVTWHDIDVGVALVLFPGCDSPRAVADLRKRLHDLQAQVELQALELQASRKTPPQSSSSSSSSAQVALSTTSLINSTNNNSALAAANKTNSQSKGNAAGFTPNHTPNASRFTNSYLPSFLTLPAGTVNGHSAAADDDVHRLNDDAAQQLAALSRDELCALVLNLQTEVLRSHHDDHPLNSTEAATAALRSNVSCVTVLPDHVVSPGSGGGLTQQQQHQQQHFDADLEQILHETETDRQRLKREMDAILFGPKSNQDVRVIPVLKQRLDSALRDLEACSATELQLRRASSESTRVSTTAQTSDVFSSAAAVAPDVSSLRAQLRQSTALVDRLKTQIELNSDCREFNPALVCQMALEIERLKDMLERTQGHAGESKSIGEGHACESRSNMQGRATGSSDGSQSSGSRSSEGGSSSSGDERQEGGGGRKRRDGSSWKYFCL